MGNAGKDDREGGDRGGGGDGEFDTPGHDIAIPYGHNQPFDLIVIRKENGSLEKAQVKYTSGDGRVVKVRVGSTSAWVRHTYSPSEVDWIAVYDASVERCFYVHSSIWGGNATLNLRLVPTANGQKKLTRSADDFTSLERGRRGSGSRSARTSELPFDGSPE